MAKYKIQLKRSVEKDISAYDKNIRQHLIRAIYKSGSLGDFLTDKPL